MKNNKKLLSILLFVIAALCLTTGIVITAKDLYQSRRADRELEAMREQAQLAQQEAPRAETEEETVEESVEETAPESVSETVVCEEETEPAAEEPARITNPYRDSYLANEDMAGWLQVPDTRIDYPIMWTPRDENYYLQRDFDGNSDKNGSLILDTDSCVDPLTTNLIIHGHNMRSGAMFGELKKYEDPQFAKDHSRTILYTKECQRNYEVIAVFRSQVFYKTDQVFKYYNFFQADTQEEFDDFYNNIMEMSLYDTGVTASFGDHFITLSTCAYHVESGRFVVVAKEIESGDFYLPIDE